ncbi:N-acyl-D-aspartate deacylase [Pandoraea terrae]|uniref:N-acyl-D-aspartate deacylase n=1 Tax=Pandoraea terrae TaxID=1537710 RepID=A0A5E4TC08_9BURK|nr:amidohydrolase family protein [Pandoraea terrae]VVD85726.1 N-acyl-D-aspartate deacylase [Pandoraea terrae]
MAGELVIRGGLVVDGTGSEPFRADVAISGDTIVAIGLDLPVAGDEIDATGCIVTPGFIDLHTHYDGQAIWSDRLDPSSGHGVTTTVIGNCGVGFAPCRAENRDQLVDLMQGVEDIPGIVMADGLTWEWESFPDYLNALERRPRDANILAYVPHSALRVYAMGERALRREPATPGDIETMQRLIREAMDAGAAGFATSRQFIHRTGHGELIPSYDSGEGELSALITAMEDRRRVFQIVLDVPRLGWEEELAMLRRVVGDSDRPTMFSFAQGVDSDAWRIALARVHEANADGQNIRPQIFPRPIGIILGHRLTANPFTDRPTFKRLPMDFASRIAMLRKPEIRAAILAEQDDADGNPLRMMASDFERIFPLRADANYEPDPQDSVAAQAGRRGISVEEVAYDLLLEDNGEAMLLAAVGNYANGHLDHVREMLDDPTCVIGLGDGGAHYGLICDASFPSFVLAHWGRDRTRGTMPLPQLVKALSADTAAAIGITDRGTIKPGLKADINIIEFDALRLHKPKIVHDLPAGGMRLTQDADGYRATLVNGAVIRREGQSTAARPGTLIRMGR